MTQIASCIVIVWALVAVILTGIAREQAGKFEGGMWGITLWPLAVGFLLVVGLFWCMTWLGRGPTKLVNHLVRCRRQKRNARERSEAST